MTPPEPQTPDVVEGWVLVPVEPTEAMCRAWGQSHLGAHYTKAEISAFSDDHAEALAAELDWSAMLAAAPSREQSAIVGGRYAAERDRRHSRVFSHAGGRRMTPTPDSAVTPAKLRGTRKTLGLTQAQFGELLGMARETIGGMERGQAPIERRTALAVLYLAQSISNSAAQGGVRHA